MSMEEANYLKLKTEERQQKIDLLAADIVTLCKSKGLSISDSVRAAKSASRRMWKKKQEVTLDDVVGG